MQCQWDMRSTTAYAKISRYCTVDNLTLGRNDSHVQRATPYRKSHRRKRRSSFRKGSNYSSTH